MRGKLIALVVLVFAVGLVGLSAVGGALYWDRVQTRAMQEASADLPLRTTEEIPPKIFGYDYQTVERSLTDAATLLTPPDYRREFEERAAKDIIPQARARQVVSQAHVVGAGMLSAQRDSASVLVFMNRTVTDKSKQPVYDAAGFASITRRSTAGG